MLQATRLEKPDWQLYFRLPYEGSCRSRTETVVAGLPADAAWVALAGIACRSETDRLEIARELADKASEDYVILTGKG